MNKKVKYRLWKYQEEQPYRCIKVVQGYAEMLSLKRQWRKQGYQVEIDKEIKGNWKTIEKRH